MIVGMVTGPFLSDCAISCINKGFVLSKDRMVAGQHCGFENKVAYIASITVLNTNEELQRDFTAFPCRDGAVVRAPAFHQCGQGSVPGLDVICGLSLLLVLFYAPRGFSPGTPVFPSPEKTNTSEFQFDPECINV